MVDHSTAALGANMAILIAAITQLTVSVNENNRIREQGMANTTQTPPLEEETPTASSSVPSPPSEDDLSPQAVRARLAILGSSTQGQWYTVTVGYQPGIYRDIAEVAHLTSGISGNMYKKYASQELALDAYEAAFDCGAIKRVR